MRRKGTGQAYAGEDGDLFLITDGVHPVWDTQIGEVYPDVEQARRAWPLVRAMTWRHEYREDVWPPGGAVVYDGLACRTERVGPDAPPGVLAAAVADDLARLAGWRRENPRAAAEIGAELDEYAAALSGVAELVAGGGVSERWVAVTRRRGHRAA